MKVQELIEALQALNQPDRNVIADCPYDYEGINGLYYDKDSRRVVVCITSDEETLK